MDLLFEVTSGDAAGVLVPLAKACGRRGTDWAAFFTNDGVEVLRDSEVLEALQSSSQAIACQDSWNHFLPGEVCPVELGSQTSNSALLADAARIVSL